jgi:plastocyanin
MRSAARRSLFAIAVFALACLPDGRADPSARVIDVDKLAFGPAPEGLKVGDTVKWRNRDIFRHSATAKDGSFDVDLPAGRAGKATLKRSGKIDYFCRFHPGMTGTLIVAP